MRGSSEGEQKRRGGAVSHVLCVVSGIASVQRDSYSWLAVVFAGARDVAGDTREGVGFVFAVQGTCRIRVSLCLAAYYGRTPELSRGDRRCFSCRVFCLPRETRRWPRCFFSAFLRLGFVPVVLVSVCLFSRAFFVGMLGYGLVAVVSFVCLGVWFVLCGCVGRRLWER